jgi:penicillin-binding protein 1C
MPETHASKRDYSALYLPGAIIIAGVLIAGGLYMGLSSGTVALLLFGAFLLFGSLCYGILRSLLKDLPSATSLQTYVPALSTKLYDRNGTLLYTFYKDENRTWIPLSSVPYYTRLAIVAAEDAEFFYHQGFSFRGIIRSLLKDIQEGKLAYGGSTITQQLLKNTLLTNERTFTRKLRELILSFQVERLYTKDQILEMYLNEVPFGGTVYGIEEASQTYFGKTTQNLTLSESALLAGLPKNPSTFSPFTNTEAAITRQKEVLSLMHDHQFISDDEYQKSLTTPLSFSTKTQPLLAPHFVMYVRDVLLSLFGEEAVYHGGLHVTTTLDLSLNDTVQSIITRELSKVKNLHVTNSSALVLNPHSGEILSMIGSKDYNDPSIDGNVNVATSIRPPGSSIKVLTYAYALSHGMTPETIIPDVPTKFYVPGLPVYEPKNYDGGYRGPLPIRSTLAESRNIPAVRVLYHFGLPSIIDLGRSMGITSWKDPSSYGLSLTLGGANLSLIELATVYATVANYGKTPTLTSLLQVTDNTGAILYKNPCTDGVSCVQPQALDPRIAFQLTDILRDNVARTPAFGSRSALFIPEHPEVAVKTGTSNDLRDNLTVGYTPSRLVAVWVGNSDNSPMVRIASGVTGAAPIWRGIMDHLLPKESVAWKTPDGLVQLSCNGRTDWFTQETPMDRACVSLDFNPQQATIGFPPRI